MKKVMIVLLLIALCLAAGAGIFIATFNADRYRPMAVEKITQAIGTPVDLGRLSLVWSNGIAVRVEGLSIYSDTSKSSKSLEVQDASAVLRLMPLLKKEIQLGSIVVRKPSVHLVRGSDGVVTLPGIKTPSGAATSPAGSSASGAAPALSISAIDVQDGEVFFEDQNPSQALSLKVHDLDLSVKNFSLQRPFSFDVSAGIFSAKQNIHVKGRIQLPQAAQQGLLEDLSFESGLADWELEEAARAFPALAQAGIEGNLGGRIRIQCDHLDLDPAGIGKAAASVKLENGAVKLKTLRSPLEKIQLSAGISGGDLRIEEFSADFAQGKLKASGSVRQFMGQASSDLRWSSQDLSIDDLVPVSAENAPRLGGRLTLNFEGTASGTAWPQISQTLSGQGSLGLKDGVLLNYNLLKEAIDKISIIPGAEGVLQEKLPGLYKAKLGEPSTLFKPMEMPFAIQNGQVSFDRLFLQTDLLALQGAGQVGLDSSLQVRARLRMEKGLSGAISALLPQVEVLKNPQAEIEIPLQIQGRLPMVSVLPDKDYLVQKLLAGQAQQLITNLASDPSKSIDQVRNLLDKPTAAGEAGVKNSLEGILGSKDGLKNLLSQSDTQPQTTEGSQQ